jgi:hypothetical protein
MRRLPDEMWDIVVSFLDLASLQSLLLFLPQTRCDHHFHATLTKELENLRKRLEIHRFPDRSTLLFLTAVYLYHPHIVRKLTIDPYLDRFVRFFREVPSLLVLEENMAPSRFLRHHLKDYKLGIMH